MTNFKNLPIILILLSFGCFTGEKIRDFKSDGCTLFPDRSFIDRYDWCQCCFEHDIAYWQGGTSEERLQADLALKDCLLAKTESEAFANLVYQGVRFGGSPYFYNWYRWGYGWSYQRKYTPLTQSELTQVKSKLEQYYRSNPQDPCQ